MAYRMSRGTTGQRDSSGESDESSWNIRGGGGPFAGNPWLVWTGADRRLLAVELAVAGNAHGVPVFSPLAGIHPDGGCAGAGAHWQFILDSLQESFRAVVCRV